MLPSMNINDRLYVEIHPLEGAHIPHPHPVTEAHFDLDCVYKVLGMYNPSETSECYMVLANPLRQIWFISQRHLLAYGLLDSDELVLPISRAVELRRRNRKVPGSGERDFHCPERLVEENGHYQNRRREHQE